MTGTLGVAIVDAANALVPAGRLDVPDEDDEDDAAALKEGVENDVSVVSAADSTMTPPPPAAAGAEVDAMRGCFSGELLFNSEEYLGSYLGVNNLEK
jgi:hypothetical protein